MNSLSMRMPFPPAVLITLMTTMLLLFSAYLIAPASVRLALLVCAGLMVAVVAFTSVELTLYLLILATLLSPEFQLAGGAQPGGSTTA